MSPAVSQTLTPVTIPSSDSRAIEATSVRGGSTERRRPLGCTSHASLRPPQRAHDRSDGEAWSSLVARGPRSGCGVCVFREALERNLRVRLLADPVPDVLPGT